MTQEQTQQQRVVAGRYTVVRELGRGGMGVVWLAEDGMIGRRVAIKELRLPDGIPPDERHVFEERVLREARSAGRLNDPAIVTVYDVLQEAGATFIVMELIEAPTLAEVVRTHGPLPEQQVARIAEQLLSALDAAHHAGIVHRDVKPSNVMVGANGRVKLTDFGIAQSTEDSRLTTSGTLIGSPTYMAPERLTGQEAVPASDLWALGATLFFAVEGYGPYERPTAAASIQAILNEVAYLNRCRGPLASVIMGLLNSAPAGRPTTSQVRDLLGQAFQLGPSTGGQATAVAPAPLPAPTQHLAGPSRSGGRRAAATTGVVVLAAGLLAAGWFGRDLFTGGGGAPADTAMQPTFTYGEGGNVPVFDVYFNAGSSCLETPVQESSVVKSDKMVDCAKEEHSAELFMAPESFKEAGSTSPAYSYPAGDLLKRYAESACTLAFESDLVDRTGAALRYRALVPSEREWNAEDNPARKLFCIAWHADGSAMPAGSVVRTGR